MGYRWRRGFGRRLVVDVTPLRESRDFRQLYLGHLLAFLGRQVTLVAVPYQVYVLTESTLAVGALGLVQVVPLVAASLVGGAVVDAIDRRKLLFFSQLLLALTSLGLLANAAAPDPQVWPLFVLSAVNAGFSSVDNPARLAVLPTLLRREQLPAGLALNQTTTQVGSAVGPALAGLLIAQFSLTAAYALEGVLFVAAALTMRGIRPLPPEGGGRRVGWLSIAEGLRYLRGQRLLRSVFVIDLNAMVLSMPRALFPAMGTGAFGGDASTVGFLFAAPGAGALVAAITAGWVGAVRRQGRMVMVAVAAWGAAMAVFGLVRSLPLALLMLAVAGAADVVSAVFRTTILQLTAPDALRGRMSATHSAVTGGGPYLGDMLSGTLATATSVRFAVVSGGLACILGVAAIGRYLPELWRYGRDDPG